MLRMHLRSMASFSFWLATFLLVQALQTSFVQARIHDKAALDIASKSLDAYLATTPIPTRLAPPPQKTDRAALRKAVLAGKYTSRLSDTTRTRCPVECNTAGLNSSSWYVYHNLDRLSLCNRPMLLDFALFNPLDSPKTHNKISACTANIPVGLAVKALRSDSCASDGVNKSEIHYPLQLATTGPASPNSVADVIAALQQLGAVSRLNQHACNETIDFAYSGKAIIGIYVGSGLVTQNIISDIIAHLATQIQGDGIVADNLVVQLCDSLTARYSMGIAINTKTNTSAVQLGVQSWKNGSCLSMIGNTSLWQNISFLVPSHLQSVNDSATNTSSLTIPLSKLNGPKVTPRAICATVRVVASDTCATLAAECGITPATFTTYNPSSTLCSTLAVGQYVCCSAGTLPDNTPKPQSNGYCYSYMVVTGDSCSALAASYGLTVAKIESFNTATWGWNGCASLFAANYICLSTGFPPMPATIPNSVCGPQVNKTATAPPGTDLRTLNQCPLNACCDIWGQCGTTSEFCTISNSTTGNPGTAAPGQNGCISNCGSDIIVSAAPAQPFSIAYFEGFDWTRPCLSMLVSEIDTSLYTHVHFAFATINPDWTLNTTAIQPQLPLLKYMTGIKRIISIGGWDFCTDPSTYMVFRQVVSSEASRQTLIKNVVDFLIYYDLDGVDWDWEYPGEPDIPGIPAGSDADSIGFFLLLDELQISLAANAPGKSVSLTAPASFWYLQHFPITALMQVIDYIVYMTYDMHGQWDYGRAYSDTGCKGGNCLRSHVNLTETINALSMITKAGIPSNKVAVGVSSYARSFQMTTVGCWTEMCTYTGPNSGALAGPCTGTAGYISDYELGLVISGNPTAQTHWDQNSYSDILVYNQNQWAAYMSTSNKAVRKLLYGYLTFLGVADWAVDLQKDGSGALSTKSSTNGLFYVDPGIWNSASLLVTALPGVTLVWPPMPLGTTTTITFPLLTTTIVYSSLTTLTSTLGNGLQTTYPWYIHVSIFTIVTIPPVTTTAIPVWGVNLGPTSSSGIIYLTSSVQPPPFGVTITPVIGGTVIVNGATATSTTSGTTVLWGQYVWEQPTETETLGGSTTIVGGRTLAPTRFMITPHVYPTTVPPGTDSKLNSKGIGWTSGTPMKPTGLPGCPGCGLPCILFCDSGCPFCPPGVFGADLGGNDNNNNDPTSTGTKSRGTSSGTATATVLVDWQPGSEDEFPQGPGDLSLLDALFMKNSAEENLIFPVPVSTVTVRSTLPTPTLPPTTTVVVVVVTATPTPPPFTATCWVKDQLAAYEYSVWNIQGWAMDKGASLKKQESGCGALTFWHWYDATDTRAAYAQFYLPFIMKPGCVERAIVSAGGPKISCDGKGLPIRALEARTPAPWEPSMPPPTKTEIEILVKVYGNETMGQPHHYYSMNWNTLNAPTKTA